jgi:hypothetical protein
MCLNFNYRISMDSLPRILECHITFNENLWLTDIVDRYSSRLGYRSDDRSQCDRLEKYLPEVFLSFKLRRYKLFKYLQSDS